MATVQGLSGSITMPSGFNIKHADWDLAWVMETVDTTGFESGGFRDRKPVISSFTGSTSGTGEFDASNTSPIPAALMDGSVMTGTDLAGASGTLTMQATTSCTVAATCNVTNWNASRPNDNKMECSYDFESDGPITISWDETP